MSKTAFSRKLTMKRILSLTITWMLSALLTGGVLAAPLARLDGPADWKDWRAAGQWQWIGNWIGGAGTNAWRYAEVGGASWKDYRVDLSLRLDIASSRLEPKWEGGGWVWSSYRNNENIGGFEAGLALRKKGSEMYRVMFSLPYQEVMLWSSRGGFLQVVPLKVEAGRTYEVTALVEGPHIKVAVDRRTVIDYWERNGVLASGGMALGLHEGTASFSKVSVNPVPAFRDEVPPHVANLHFRDWKGARWAWDGSEPIFFVGALHALMVLA